MKRTGPMRVLGLWISPMGDRAEAALLRYDDTGADILEVRKLALDTTSQSILSKGGTAADQLVEDCAGQLFESFEDVGLVGFQGPVLRFEQGSVLEEAGHGDVLAEAFGVPVAWDFLSEDFRLGGASPLMGFAAAAQVLSREGQAIHVDLDARVQAVWIENGAVMLAQETGPGLGLLSFWQAAPGGVVADALPEALVSASFYARMGPRAVPSEMSDRAAVMLADLPAADALATARAMIVAGILQSVEQGPFVPERVVISGRGVEDVDLTEMLEAGLGADVIEFHDQAGLQAIGVALLSARLVRGKTTSGPTITGVPTSMAGGQISGR